MRREQMAGSSDPGFVLVHGGLQWAARRLFGNDLDATGTARLLDQLSPESAVIGLEAVSRQGLSPAIARTYVCLSRDRALPPRRQRRQIANLGAPCEIVTLDSGHDPFFSRPAELAAVLNQTMRPLRPSQ